jgi:hypothetical protein
MRKRHRCAQPLELAGAVARPGVVAASSAYCVCARADIVVVFANNEEMYTMPRVAPRELDAIEDGIIAACDESTVAFGERVQWAPSILVLHAGTTRLQPLPSPVVSLAVFAGSCAVGCYCGTLLVDGTPRLGPSDCSVVSICYAREGDVIAALGCAIVSTGASATIARCPEVIRLVAATPTVVAAATHAAVYM